MRVHSWCTRTSRSHAGWVPQTKRNSGLSRSLLLWTLTEPYSTELNIQYVPKRSRVAEWYRTVKFTSKERLGWIHQRTALKLKLHPANDAHGHPRRRERRRSQCGKRAREQERLPRARARRP